MTNWLRKLFGKPQPKSGTSPQAQQPLSKDDERKIERAVKRSVTEYGEALKRLGNE